MERPSRFQKRLLSQIRMFVMPVRALAAVKNDTGVVLTDCGLEILKR
jgi:hypothetical protein